MSTLGAAVAAQLSSLGNSSRPNLICCCFAVTTPVSDVRIVCHFDVNTGGNTAGGDDIDPDRSSTTSKSGGSPPGSSSPPPRPGAGGGPHAIRNIATAEMIVRMGPSGGDWTPEPNKPQRQL